MYPFNSITCYCWILLLVNVTQPLSMEVHCLGKVARSIWKLQSGPDRRTLTHQEALQTSIPFSQGGFSMIPITRR